MEAQLAGVQRQYAAAVLDQGRQQQADGRAASPGAVGAPAAAAAAAASTAAAQPPADAADAPAVLDELLNAVLDSKLLEAAVHEERQLHGADGSQGLGWRRGQAYVALAKMPPAVIQ